MTRQDDLADLRAARERISVLEDELAAVKWALADQERDVVQMADDLAAMTVEARSWQTKYETLAGAIAEHG